MPLPSMKDVDPSQLKLGSKFRFRCHKEIGCFTKCCRNINILLTPYDIVRMKDRLGMSSEEFLDEYTVMEIDEKSTLPLVRMKMADDAEKSCRFVTQDGCTIYDDRPANCRYYPIGQGTLRKETEQGPANEEFYFQIKEAHCLGLSEDTEWTVQSWRDDQHATLYDEMNKEWKEIQLRRNPLIKKLDSNQQAQIYTAFFDMDRFRRFVFESKFLELFDIAPEEIARIEKDDVALMNLGLKYVKFLLLLEETLKIKQKYRKDK